MGGLLARVLIADQPKLWQRICAHPDARLIMLGTPNRGSHTICRLLTDREPLVRGPAPADIRHSGKEVGDIVKSLLGPLEVLPQYTEGYDLFARRHRHQLA